MSKRFVFSIYFFYLFSHLGFSQCGTPNLISPSDNSNLIQGDTVSIEFTYDQQYGFYEYMHFYYSVNNGLDWYFQDSIRVDSLGAVSGDTLSFNWKVPRVVSDSCKIKLMKYRTYCWNETKGVFSISKPLLSNTTQESFEQIRIFPNPLNSGQELYIHLPNEADAIFIYHANGQLIKQINDPTNTLSLPTNNWSPGIYLINVLRNGRSKSKRLLIH